MAEFTKSEWQKLSDVTKLWVDGATQKPRHYNYFEEKYTEDWDIPFERTEEEEEGERFNPMMNYFYPLPDFEDKKRYEKLTDAEIKKRLEAAGAVTLVYDLESAEYGLALSGGGMDLSWDICRGYALLGYLPPAHFCERLPEFKGEDMKRPENKIVIDACKRSLDMVRYHAGEGLKRLEDFKKRGVL